MRIVLTGATGFVGSEVLKQLLIDAETEGVTCLTRREIEIEHPKLRMVIHEDFTIWPTALAEILADHSGLIWALGANATNIPDIALYQRITVQTTLSCAGAISRHLAHPFRFCYLSGMGADPDEKTTFPWQRTTRHMKGRAERGLQQLTTAKRKFSATVFRPGGILSITTGGWMDTLLSPIAIRVDHLARVMISEARVGETPPYQVLSNRSIRDIRA